MSARTRIKICGVMRPDDALAAAEAGADAIGMILHANAPRRIEREVARAIVHALPKHVTPVGVFVDASAETIRETAADLNLRHVQLQGDEPPELLSKLGGLSVTRAIRSRSGLEETLDRWHAAVQSGLDNLHGMMIETAASEQAGGTGIESDWSSLAAVRDHPIFQTVSFVAAGGLRPATVGAVIARLHPNTVDLSSGVERERGKKSPELLREFCEAVRTADAIRTTGTAVR